MKDPSAISDFYNIWDLKSKAHATGRIFMYSDLKVFEKNKYLISLNLRLNGKQSILINYLNKVEI